ICVVDAGRVGFRLLREPAQGMVTIALLLIVFFMIEGISKVAFALTIRPFPNWGWVMASGLVGILLAVILWANLPVTAVWLIGLLLGINLISVGAAIAYLAWQVRKTCFRVRLTQLVAWPFYACFGPARGRSRRF